MAAAPNAGMSRRVTVRAKGQLTLPAEIRDALHIAEGDEVEFAVQDDGTVQIRGLVVLPADQAWFWTPEWQAGEREASAQIAAGEGVSYENDDDFFASLNTR